MEDDVMHPYSKLGYGGVLFLLFLSPSFYSSPPLLCITSEDTPMPQDLAPGDMGACFSFAHTPLIRAARHHPRLSLPTQPGKLCSCQLFVEHCFGTTVCVWKITDIHAPEKAQLRLSKLWPTGRKCFTWGSLSCWMCLFQPSLTATPPLSLVPRLSDWRSSQ